MVGGVLFFFFLCGCGLLGLGGWGFFFFLRPLPLVGAVEFQSNASPPPLFPTGPLDRHRSFSTPQPPPLPFHIPSLSRLGRPKGDSPPHRFPIRPYERCRTAPSTALFELPARLHFRQRVLLRTLSRCFSVGGENAGRVVRWSQPPFVFFPVPPPWV